MRNALHSRLHYLISSQTRSMYQYTMSHLIIRLHVAFNVQMSTSWWLHVRINILFFIKFGSYHAFCQKYKNKTKHYYYYFLLLNFFIPWDTHNINLISTYKDILSFDWWHDRSKGLAQERIRMIDECCDFV